MEQNSEKLETTSIKLEKPLRDKSGKLLPNQQSLNPAGRPVGSRNFEVDFDEAVCEIAKENGMTRSEARKLLLKVAFKNAKEGNYSFYKDIHDRIYGQASQKIDTENKNVNINLVIEDKDKIKNVIRDISTNN